VCKSLIFLPIN